MTSQGPLGGVSAGVDDDDESEAGSLAASSAAHEAGGLGAFSLRPAVRSSSPVTLKGASVLDGPQPGSLRRVPTLEGWDSSLQVEGEGGRPRADSVESLREILAAVGGEAETVSPNGTTIRRSEQKSPPGVGAHEEVEPGRRRRAVQAFRRRVKMAGHIGLAALLAVGINAFYPWSENLTWYSIVLSISGVGRNLGHTLQGVKDSWLGAALAVPLCLLLGQAIFSQVLVGLLVSLTAMLVVACTALTEPAKKVALIFIIWDVLIPAVSPVTIVHLLINLLKALLGANIISLVAVMLPVPQLGVWDMCSKLEEVTVLMQLLLEHFIAIFNLHDREVVDLEELLDQCTTLLAEMRALLPDVKNELWIFRSGPAYHRLVRYLHSLEAQLERLQGMALSLSDISPNDTHAEYVRQMERPLGRLLKELAKATIPASQSVCQGLLGRPSKYDDDQLASAFSKPKDVLQRCLRAVLRARMRVVYGREVVRDPGTNTVVLKTSASAQAAAAAFVVESRRLGYMNLLPRNTFVLDLALFVEAVTNYATTLLEPEAEAAEAVPPEVPPAKDCDEEKGLPSGKSAAAAHAAKRGFDWQRHVKEPVLKALSRVRATWPSAASGWLQAFKVALAVGLASVEVLVQMDTLGPQTIWAPLTVASTMSSHPASSFKSGVNRAQGTIIGTVFGMALMEWLRVRSKPAIVVLLTLWVFVCGLNRTSRTYGEAAVTAALTAPIVVVGPVLGGPGLVVRNMQIILGTVIYVAVDNLLWPKRAKASVREQLLASVQHFKALWLDELTIFTSNVDESALEHGRQEAENLRRTLTREEAFIKLAAEEPELWHKPFPLGIYSRVLASQWGIFRMLVMLHRSSMTFPMELAEHDHRMLASLQSVLNRLKQVTLTVFSEALARLQALNQLQESTKEEVEEEEDVTPLLSMSGLRQQFHRIECETDDVIEGYFSQEPVLTSIDFVIPLNSMLFSTRKLSTQLLRFSQAVKELVDRERGDSA